MNNLEYFIFGAVGILCVFSLAIGLERMIKVVIANYMLTGLCLSLRSVIDRFVTWMETIYPGSANNLSFLIANKTIVILIIYLLLLLLIFLKSNVRVSMNASGMKRFLLTLLFVPLTVVSIILSLELAIIGLDSFNITQMTLVAHSFTANPVVFGFVQMTAVWFFVQTLLTILLISNIKITLPTFRRASAPSLDGIDMSGLE